MRIQHMHSVVVTAILVLSGSHLAAQQSVVPVPEQPPQPNSATGENFQVLTRGPVHEAFAAQMSQKPAAGFRVDQEVPEAIDEIPPETRPEGDNVVWIPGYWHWDNERNDFIWISGVWRNTPPDHRWIPGYWSKNKGQSSWVSGFWTAIDAAELNYVPEPPESLEAGPSSDPPSSDHFWIPGNWVYRTQRYAWRPGYWAHVHTGYMWVPAHYAWTPHGCLFISGYWDYPFQRRGLLHCPIYFQAGYQQIRFRPRIALHASNSFLHLFIQSGSNHFYFGNYYGTNYRQNFYPWYDFRRVGRRWDPFYTYLRARQRRDGIDYLNRCHRWHDHYVANVANRPRTTFINQQINIRTTQRRQGQAGQRRSVLAHGTNDVRGRRRLEQKLTTVTARDHDRDKNEIAELRRLKRRRQRLEQAVSGTPQDAQSVADTRRRRRENDALGLSNRPTIGQTASTRNNPRDRRRGQPDRTRTERTGRLSETANQNADSNPRRRRDRRNGNATTDATDSPTLAENGPNAATPTTTQSTLDSKQNRQGNKRADEIAGETTRPSRRPARASQRQPESQQTASDTRATDGESAKSLTLEPRKRRRNSESTPAPPRPRAEAGRVTSNESEANKRQRRRRESTDRLNRVLSVEARDRANRDRTARSSAAVDETTRSSEREPATASSNSTTRPNRTAPGRNRSRASTSRGSATASSGSSPRPSRTAPERNRSRTSTSRTSPQQSTSRPSRSTPTRTRSSASRTSRAASQQSTSRPSRSTPTRTRSYRSPASRSAQTGSTSRPSRNSAPSRSARSSSPSSRSYSTPRPSRSAPTRSTPSRSSSSRSSSSRSSSLRSSPRPSRSSSSPSRGSATRSSPSRPGRSRN